MNIWLMMVIIGIITFGIRLSFIILWGRLEISPLAQRALRFVPAAVLSALILPEILPQPFGFPATFTNPRLWAGILAGIVAWRTRNVILTVIAGMAILLLMQRLQ